jgi:tripartite ATP-independent transporter DctP family solute receptor
MRKKIRFIMRLTCILMILYVITGNLVFAENKLLLKVSGSAATVKGNHTAETFIKFKQLVESYSDGEIEVRIFPEGTFGNEDDGVLAVRSGECHLFNAASNNFAVHSPSIWPFSFPYMFKSYEHINRLVSGAFNQEIQDRVFKESGVRIVGYPSNGWRAVSNSKKPIKKLEDMRGLKIRVPKSPTIIETFKAWGVNPTPIGWSETFTALQQKVCDGFDNPVNVIGSYRFYEVQKYVTTLKYQPQISVFVMNDQFWQNLSQKNKAAVQRALKESINWCAKYVEKSMADYTVICKKNGMVFYNLPPKEEARWSQAAKSIYPKLEKLCDKEWITKFEQAVEVAGKGL